VAGVAHDLRNPLAAMKVAVEVLSSTDSSTPERQSQVTGMIARQIDILTRMLSDLLDAARGEAGEFSIVPRPCDARDLATQAVQLFAGASPLHELRVDLPDTALPVRCDALRLGQVLNNLISNAIKYSPQGGPVTVAARRKGERIEIEVSDNGPGIPAEERTRIFEPFRRIESSAASIPGVGIGLSVARRIVEAHGGEITLRSDTARGSTFVISLPSAFAAAPAQMQVLEALSA
jgi:signal transduction histidine kinase